MISEAREEFNRLREQFRRECDDPRGDRRRGWLSDLREAFDASHRFSHVRVVSSPDPEYHIRVYCTAAPGATVEELELELKRLWLEQIHQDEEIHILERGAASLVLDGVTAEAMGEPYLSVRVRVDGVPLDEAPAADGSDPYLVALFGGAPPESPEEEESDGGLQPGPGGSDRGGDLDLEHHG